MPHGHIGELAELADSGKLPDATRAVTGAVDLLAVRWMKKRALRYTASSEKRTVDPRR